MSNLTPRNIIKDNSLDDFVFVDAEGDLDIDLSKSPIHDATGKLGTGIASFFSALSTVVEEQGFLVSIPITAITTTAVGALTGSLIGGPAGLTVGLLTGAIMAYRTSPRSEKKEKSEPENTTTIRQVFNQMTAQQKKELIKELLSCLKESNVRMLLFQILKNEEIRNLALRVMSNFLMRKMGVSLTKSK